MGTTSNESHTDKKRRSEWLPSVMGVVVFDCFIALIFALGLIAEFQQAIHAPELIASYVPTSDSSPPRPADFYWIFPILDSIMSALAFFSAAYLVAGMRHAIAAQRWLSLGLFTRLCVYFLEGMMPSGGGIDGFLLLLATFFMIILLCISLIAASYTKRQYLRSAH